MPCRRSALRQKHTIEAVIDRFRPRDDIKQRLAESFETALRLGDGIVIAGRTWMTPKPRRSLFSVTLFLPDLRLLAARARAAPVLVQLAGRRLPDLRRPRRDPGVRSGARGRASELSAWPPARCAAGTGAIRTTSS